MKVIFILPSVVEVQREINFLPRLGDIVVIDAIGFLVARVSHAVDYNEVRVILGYLKG